MRLRQILGVLVLTATVAGCVARGAPIAAWSARLEALGLSSRGLRLGRVDLVGAGDSEPGVTPDRVIRVPAEWDARLAGPDLARLAHLARHRERGLPEVGVVGCPAWRLSMVAEELDGLAIEALARARLGAPVRGADLARALAERDAAYARRCPLTAPRAWPDVRKVP